MAFALLFSGVPERLGVAPRLFVRLYRVPHALHNIGFAAGPLRHCGESTAPQ
jgi:hypothetical protein